jgi:YEATS domain-containing protein 4
MSLIPGEQNQIIVKPFIYGSVAINLGKKSKEEATHKWCVYVRGINNENISNFIKSVKFTLHDTFPNNVRTINKWPFELYEMGWGEFDIKIQIQLVDETVKPIDLIHSLKFYNNPHQTGSKKSPVVSENYDEIIFVNPKPEILEQL